MICGINFEQAQNELKLVHNKSGLSKIDLGLTWNRPNFFLHLSGGQTWRFWTTSDFLKKSEV